MLFFFSLSRYVTVNKNFHSRLENMYTLVFPISVTAQANPKPNHNHNPNPDAERRTNVEGRTIKRYMRR